MGRITHTFMTPITRARRKQGLLAKDVAKQLGMSKQNFSFVESGLKTSLTLAEFIYFCNIVNIDPAKAFTEAYEVYVSKDITQNLFRYQIADTRAFEEHRNRMGLNEPV